MYLLFACKVVMFTPDSDVKEHNFTLSFVPYVGLEIEKGDKVYRVHTVRWNCLSEMFALQAHVIGNDLSWT